jgi:hypothetical protein
MRDGQFNRSWQIIAAGITGQTVRHMLEASLADLWAA